MIPATGKSEYLYEQIFNQVRKIYLESGHNINDIPKKIMIDFESSLIKVVKSIFTNSKIKGAFRQTFMGSCQKIRIMPKRKIKDYKNIIIYFKNYAIHITGRQRGYF